MSLLIKLVFYCSLINVLCDSYSASFYRIIDAFEGKIRSSVENEISKKLDEGIRKLDSVLESLPGEIPVDGGTSLNVTFIDQPKLSKNSIAFDIDGLFTPNIEFPRLSNDFQLLASCAGTSNMLEISLKDAVFNSASDVYYNVSL